MHASHEPRFLVATKEHMGSGKHVPPLILIVGKGSGAYRSISGLAGEKDIRHMTDTSLR